jgi:hypothetical protein
MADLELAMRTLSERVARIEEGQQRVLKILEERGGSDRADRADVQELREDVSRLLALMEKQPR